MSPSQDIGRIPAKSKKKVRKAKLRSERIENLKARHADSQPQTRFRDRDTVTLTRGQEATHGKSYSNGHCKVRRLVTVNDIIREHTHYTYICTTTLIQTQQLIRALYTYRKLQTRIANAESQTHS